MTCLAAPRVCGVRFCVCSRGSSRGSFTFVQFLPLVGWFVLLHLLFVLFAHRLRCYVLLLRLLLVRYRFTFVFAFPAPATPVYSLFAGRHRRFTYRVRSGLIILLNFGWITYWFTMVFLFIGHLLPHHPTLPLVRHSFLRSYALRSTHFYDAVLDLPFAFRSAFPLPHPTFLQFAVCLFARLFCCCCAVPFYGACVRLFVWLRVCLVWLPFMRFAFAFLLRYARFQFLRAWRAVRFGSSRYLLPTYVLLVSCLVGIMIHPILFTALRLVRCGLVALVLRFWFTMRAFTFVVVVGSVRVYVRSLRWFFMRCCVYFYVVT